MTTRHPLTRHIGLVAIGLVLGLGSLHGCAFHRSADEPGAAAEARSRFDPRQDEAEQWYFWTDDGVRHYAYEFGTAAGPGDTVIVLHGGWGAEHAYLIDALAPLADRYRFVLYDQRGSLRSPAPDSTVRLDRLVADLDHLRSTMGLEQVALVAHSMGNALAYAYLARHPTRVRGLVAVGAVHPAPRSGPARAAFLLEVWPEADEAELAAAMQGFLENAARRAHALFLEEGLVPDSLLHVPPLEYDYFSPLRDRDRTRAWRISFATVNTCSGHNWRAMRGGMVYYRQAAANAITGDPSYPDLVADSWPALQSFDRPIRVIMGSCDYVDLGPTLWPRIAPLLRDAALTVIEGAGHALWMDRPLEFTQALEQALNDVVSSTSLPSLPE
jgi:proline iminopeptidase